MATSVTPQRVLRLTPQEYETWLSNRTPRVIKEIPVKKVEEEEQKTKTSETSSDVAPEDKAASKRTKTVDDPTTIGGVTFDGVRALRQHVKAIIAKSNPVAEEDQTFLVKLLHLHPNAKRLFANATQSPTYKLAIQPLDNGDHGIFIEKRSDSGPPRFVHFPHKQAVKKSFPISSQPRRQTWHSLQRRRRGKE